MQIIFSFEFKVGSSVREGNIEEARSYSKRAKSLSIAAIICGAMIYILVAVLRGTTPRK